MVTLQQIADSLGVSRSTVSKALRNSSDINAETAEKIRQAAADLGYDATRLRGEDPDNRTIGIVFPELKSLYYNKIYDFFCDEIARAGYRTLVMLYNFDGVERQLEDIEFLLRQNVSGILYLTENEVEEETLRRLFRLTQTKLVMITNRTDVGLCDTISNNHSLGVKLAIDHLHALGHEKIAFLGERHTRLRCAEFISSMQRLGCTVPRDYVVELSERFEDCGYNGMKKLLALPEVPTAVFTAYDNIAYGAMRAIIEAGLRIPEDVAVIGVDDNPISRYTTPPLTSVNSPEAEIGRTAAQFMTDRINGSRKPFRNVLICPTLKVRGSAARREESGTARE